ncbi:MAG: hypothetical protein GWN13_23930, partial [Phycisphaerae bacterium]|nr:hypothetical protein [Phycisphaerae bacterium]NIX01232.1 hypothetical protein [Phycisphaerae bacterium]
MDDTVYGQGHFYGQASASTQGGSLYIYTAQDHDGLPNSINYYNILVTSDDLRIGPHIDNDALIYDGANLRWDFTDPATFSGNIVGTNISEGNLNFDDGTGDSPSLIFTDQDNNTFSILKNDSGNADLTNNEGSIHFLASGDSDDYMTVTTTSDVPTIGTAGGANLAITADSGLIDFGDENMQTTGYL